MNGSLTTLHNIINLYSFSSGRIAFVLTKVREAIEQRNDPVLAPVLEHVTHAHTRAKALRILELKFRSSRTRPRNGPNVAAIDARLDRALVAFRNAARAYVDSAGGEDDASAKLATALLNACFPDGVQALITSRFIDQLAGVDAMLAVIDAEHAHAIEDLRLDVHLERIVRLNETYRRAQGAEVTLIEYQEVREAREACYEMLLQVVVMILGRYPMNTHEHIEARTTVLASVLFHNEVIGELMRAQRGSAPDVDPETGETLTSEEGEGDEEGAQDEAPAEAPPTPAPAPVTTAPMS
jgi:hypothetical protein